MAAKRTLYKPATLQDVGSQDQRRSLTQGRLISQPVLPDTMTVFASPRDLNQNASNVDTDGLSATITHCGHLLEGAVTPPRQSLARVMTSSRILTSNNNLNKPRQSPLHVGNLPGSTHMKSPLSPSKPTPSALLELSDTENELHSSVPRSSMHHSRNLAPSPVLYVDASGGRLDPNRSEVETSTDLVVSPAKVVCHAPAVVESDLRDTGYTQETARVKVDAVPTVSLLGDLDVTQVKGGERSALPPSGSKGGVRTPLVVKENSLAGVSYQKSEVSGIEDSSGQSEGRNLSASAKPEVAVKEKKKKVKAKIVPSRYMQAATKPMPRGSSSMGESTTLAPRNASSTLPPRAAHSKKTVQTKPSHAQRFVSSSAASQPTAKSAQSQRSRSTNQSQYSYTPVARGMRRVGGVTSTPAVDDTSIPRTGHWDASAIGASMIQGPDVSIAMASASGVAMSLDGRLDSARSLSRQDDLSAPVDTSVFQAVASSSAGQDVSLPAAHKKKGPVDITQEYLDLAYGRYIQALYLDSKMEKTLKGQEKEAVSQMYGLWHENEKLRTRKRDLELELARARHANHLDQQLDVQISGLGPVVAHLDQFKRQYSTLAHALDTTRHQLATVGIHTPQDEDSYHESLVSALAESEHLLGEISLATRAHQPQVASFASALHTLQNAVENEDRELKRCQELLSATCTLTTQESSLRIQQMEH